MVGAKPLRISGPADHRRESPGGGRQYRRRRRREIAADGYTILQNTNGQAISPSIYRSHPLDVVRDFIPVTQLVASQLVLVASPKLAAPQSRN